MKSLADEWGAILAALGPEERAVFEASRARQAAYVAALQTWTPDAGPLPRGRPIDWAHDGSERHFDGTAGYGCWTCRDSGFVRREGLTVGQAGFGQHVPCSCQGGIEGYRRRQEAASFHARRAGSFLPARYDDKTLDSFVRIEGTADAAAAAETWRYDWEHTGAPGWLVLWGETGSGKSHLLAALANVVLTTTPMLWIDVPWWLEQIAADSFAHADSFKKPAHEARVLVLDEFGSQSTPDWARQWLETVVVERYGRGQATLFGMTCLPAELAAFSRRVEDRLRDRQLVQHGDLTAGSYRPLLARTEPAA